MPRERHPEVQSSPPQSGDGASTASPRRPARTSDTLIFVPTYNERDSIESLIDQILSLPVRCDLLFVDDNSKDSTLEILTARASAEPRITLVVRRKPLGVGSAHQLAWLHARRFGYARLVSLDADLSHDPADIPRLLAALDAGADVAIGSRFIRGGQLDYRGWRRLLSVAANNLAPLLLSLPLTELTTSFRAAKLSRVPAGLIETIKTPGYGFFLVGATRLARQRLVISEIPIHFRDRSGGRSKMPRLEILRGTVNLLRLMIRRGRVVPPSLPQEADSECRSCGQPYRVATVDGEIVCLACYDRSPL